MFGLLMTDLKAVFVYCVLHDLFVSVKGLGETTGCIVTLKDYRLSVKDWVQLSISDTDEPEPY